MPEWLAIAGNIASIAEAVLALVAVILAIIALKAARPAWISVRDFYKDYQKKQKMKVEEPQGTVVQADNIENINNYYGQPNQPRSTTDSS